MKVAEYMYSSNGSYQVFWVSFVIDDAKHAFGICEALIEDYTSQILPNIQMLMALPPRKHSYLGADYRNLL